MKKWLFAITFCFCVTVLSAQSKKQIEQHRIDSVQRVLKIHRDSVRQTTIGQSFPEFQGMTMDNKSISSNSIHGSVTLVNFWFAACPACKAEFAGLQQLYDSLKNESGFQMISFTFENAEIIDRIKNKYDINFPIVSLPKEECRRLKIIADGYPTNMILDRNGKVVFYKTGGESKIKEATAYVMSVVYNRVKEVLSQP